MKTKLTLFPFPPQTLATILLPQVGDDVDQYRMYAKSALSAFSSKMRAGEPHMANEKITGAIIENLFGRIFDRWESPPARKKKGEPKKILRAWFEDRPGIALTIQEISKQTRLAYSTVNDVIVKEGSGWEKGQDYRWKLKQL